MENKHGRKDDKILTARCQYCNKVIYSMYEEQVTYNHAAHEIACKVRKKLQGELHPAVKAGDASKS